MRGGFRVAGIPFAEPVKIPGHEEESINVRQSAKQLDLQKNILLNGFDSSTENQAIFKPILQKNEVAPFLVKIEKRCPRERKISAIKTFNPSPPALSL